MIIESSRDEPCSDYWSGDEIYFNINGQRNHTIEPGYKKHEFCSSINQVNITNDIFELQPSDSEGFCIESLIVNGKDILKLNGAHNNCDYVGMTTSNITIQGGELIYLECTGE